MTDKTITLKKPITHGNEEITHLTFREPTGEDIMECGFPTTVKSDGGKKFEIAVDAAIAGALMSKLASVPPSVVAKMHYLDFQAASAVVAAFFKDSVAGLN